MLLNQIVDLCAHEGKFSGTHDLPVWNAKGTTRPRRLGTADFGPVTSKNGQANDCDIFQ